MRKPVFISCGKCNNGYIYSYEDGYEKVTKCDCLLKYQIHVYLQTYLKKSNIPLSILKYSIDTYIGPDKENNIPKLKNIVENFKNVYEDKLIYFYGTTGTQKTTLAWWLGRELLKKKVSVYYCFMNELIEDLTEDRFSDESKLSKYNVDCLIIDRAFDKDQMTVYKSGYQLPFLDNFLRKRVEVEERCTILISNVQIDTIADHKMNTDIEDFVRRKVIPYKDTYFHFKDHYSLKEDFDKLEMWRQ